MAKKFVRTTSDFWNYQSNEFLNQYKNSIVFIEDTQQIWSNGIYYNCYETSNEYELPTANDDTLGGVVGADISDISQYDQCPVKDGKIYYKYANFLTLSNLEEHTYTTGESTYTCPVKEGTIFYYTGDEKEFKNPAGDTLLKILPNNFYKAVSTTYENNEIIRAEPINVSYYSRGQYKQTSCSVDVGTEIEIDVLYDTYFITINKTYTDSEFKGEIILPTLDYNIVKDYQGRNIKAILYNNDASKELRLELSSEYTMYSTTTEINIPTKNIAILDIIICDNCYTVTNIGILSSNKG